MDNVPFKDQSFTANTLWAWEPVEVILPENREAGAAKEYLSPELMSQFGIKPREPAETRPSTEQMMSAFRALRRRRASASEDEIVIEDMLADDSPASLRANLRRATEAGPEPEAQ